MRPERGGHRNTVRAPEKTLKERSAGRVGRGCTRRYVEDRLKGAPALVRPSKAMEAEDHDDRKCTGALVLPTCHDADEQACSAWLYLPFRKGTEDARDA